MSAFSGLPDFSAPISTAGVTAFAPFQNGSYAVVPQQLSLALDADASPKFTLDLVERAGDFSAAGQYAVLDFSLAGDFELDTALAVVRPLDAAATVTPIAAAGGFARLYPTAGEVAPSSDALAPIPLGFSGADFARWTTRLSADAGELIKGAIAGGSLLLGARVEFDALGVAARVETTVAFEPEKLVASLLAGTTGRLLSAPDVLAAFTGTPEKFPLKILAGDATTGDFAAAVADRILASYASRAPAPASSDPSFVAFADPSALPLGAVQWDLSQPAIGRRQWVLMLDILTVLRAFAARNGTAALVRNVSVPALQVGLCKVDVDANLPPNRIGVPAIGVTANVAANPPLRPSSIAQTIAFTEPDDDGSLTFQISPAETLSYTLSGFAVLAAAGMVREFAMPPQLRSSSWVQLGADDFPVAFAHVTAANRLLSLAVLTLTLTYALDGAQHRVAAVLNAKITGASMAVPRSASDPSLTVSAAPLDGSAPLGLGPLAPGRIDLDLPAFAEFGPHRVTIRAALRSGDRALMLDAIAQDDEDAGAPPAQLLLTADQPSADWGYVASSPFKAGYRYRKSATGSAPAGAWSALQSPFTPLMLAADGTPVSASAASAQPALTPVPATTP